jgi:hypothetical protein
MLGWSPTVPAIRASSSRTLSWEDARSGEAATPGGAKLSEGFEDQLAAFRAKVGRDPGWDDPFFFDPDADEPTPLSADAWHALLVELIGNAEQIGIDPAYLRAVRELGYLITNRTGISSPPQRSRRGVTS